MALILNKSTSTRVFFLRGGSRIVLAPGEVYISPASLDSDIDALIRSKSFRQLMDLNLMATSKGRHDEELVDGMSPEPPESLSTSQTVKDTNIVVSANEEARYNSSPKNTIKVIGSTEL